MKKIDADNDIVKLTYLFDDDNEEIHEKQCEQLMEALDDLYESLSYDDVYLVDSIHLTMNCVDKSFDFQYGFVEGLPESEREKLRNQLNDLMKTNIVF